ncbi:MAG: hypothetical protein GQ558_08470 [Thermoplasmata archaeon]|nr:hypothetical protein [Thermoplasmata archaeon]
MLYQAFFLVCLIGVIVISIFFRVRVKALVFGCVGLGIGYLFERRGLENGEWDYAAVDSLLKVTGIPIEVLIGYFTAAFLIIILIDNIPDLSTVERRESALRYLFLAAGIGVLLYTYASSSMSLAVGWAFLGIFGLMVSPDKSIPLGVGLVAFLGDWIVEGALTMQSEYYANGWDPTIGLVFMFCSMFVAGVLTDPRLLGRYATYQS